MVVIDEFDETSEERAHNDAQILMKLFNLYSLGRLSMLDKTPLVYAFRNAPHNCHRTATHSVSFARSLSDFKKNHLPLINTYGAANSVVTAYTLKPYEVEQGFGQLRMKPAELNTADMQSRMLQCAYFLVLKPSIKNSYEIFIKGRQQPESAIDRVLAGVL